MFASGVPRAAGVYSNRVLAWPVFCANEQVALRRRRRQIDGNFASLKVATCGGGNLEARDDFARYLLTSRLYTITVKSDVFVSSLYTHFICITLVAHYYYEQHPSRAAARPTCPIRISKQTSLRAVLRVPRYFGLAHDGLRHNEFVDELGIRKFGNRRVSDRRIACATDQ